MWATYLLSWLFGKFSKCFLKECWFPFYKKNKKIWVLFWLVLDSALAGPWFDCGQVKQPRIILVGFCLVGLLVSEFFIDFIVFKINFCWSRFICFVKRKNTKTSPLKSLVSSSFWNFWKRKEFFVHLLNGHVCMLGKIKSFISLIFIAKESCFL